MSAEVTVDFIGKDESLEKAFEKLNQNIEKATAALKKLNSEGGGGGGGGGGVAKMAIGIAAANKAFDLLVEGIGKVADFTKSAVIAAAQQEKQFSRLSTVIRNNGDAYGITAQQLSDMSDKLALQTGFTSDANNEAMIFLATLKNIKAPEQFQDVLEVSQDVATVFGTSLPAAAKAVGKALDNPIQGMTNLRKYGVMLTEEQKNQVTAFMAVNDVASAQGIIMDTLKSKVEGAAEAFGKTGVGQLQRFQNLLEQMKEGFGKGILEVVIEQTDKLLENAERAKEISTSLGNTAAEGVRAAGQGVGVAAEAYVGYGKYASIAVDEAITWWSGNKADETPQQRKERQDRVASLADGSFYTKQAEEQERRRAEAAANVAAEQKRTAPLINTDFMYNNRLPNGKYITDAPDTRAMMGPQMPGSGMGMSKMDRDNLIHGYKQDMTRMENRPEYQNFMPGLMQFGRAAWNNRGLIPSADEMIRGAGDLAGQFTPKGVQSSFEDAQGMYDRIAASAGTVDTDKAIERNTAAAVNKMAEVKDEVVKVGTALANGGAAVFQAINPF